MKSDPTTQVFQALADPTRRAILARIAQEQVHVAELAGHFPISRPAISKHLRTLKSAGLVVDQESGKKRIYSLNPRPLVFVDLWLDQYRRFWNTSLQNLKKHVESGKA